jgi:nickel-dependent lactate racemase
MTQNVSLPQFVWQGAREVDFPLPAEWRVEVCRMKGHARPALSRAQIAQALKSPLGVAPIRQAARGRQQVVIIFDDVQRATRVSDVLPAVLQELAEAGIKDNQVRLIAATGCHGAMDREDFARKLGEGVVRRFPVYNHNAFGDCRDLGQTSFGTQVRLNAEVMNCDYKIAIGSVVPHAFAGFGGGAKIILPGLCHYQTVMDFHQAGARLARQNADRASGIGVMEGNPLRSNMEEAARMVGLDIKIDILLNSLGETAALYAGSLESAYPLAVKDAQSHYDTPQPAGKDIVIANSFAKAAESESGLEMAIPSLKKSGGSVILIANAPEGHVSHYLAGPWGNLSEGSFQMRCALPRQLERLIIYSQYPDLTMYGYFAQPEKVTIVTEWDRVLAELCEAYPGERWVAVYPDADIQYSSRASGSQILSFIEKG